MENYQPAPTNQTQVPPTYTAPIQPIQAQIPQPAPSHASQSTQQISPLSSKSLVIALCVIGAILLLGGGYLIALTRQPRVITTYGRALLSFEVDRSEISIIYAKRGEDRDSLVNSSKVDFDAFTRRMADIGATVSQTGGQLIPVGAGTFEYRQAAVVKATGSDVIRDTINALNTENVLMVATRYYPKDDQTTQDQLLAKALEQAEIKAKNLAKSSKNGIGKLVNVTEVGSTTETGTNVTNQNADTTEGNPTQIELEKTVGATYLLR